MVLVKRELPRYSNTLPVSGDEFSYRPYTVKEERVLMMAGTPGTSDKDKYAAIHQIVENCTDINMAEAHPTDVEWAFFQIRKTSNSNQVDVSYTIPLSGCGLEPHQVDKECPKEIKTSFLLDHIETEFGDMEGIAEQRPNGAWIIEIMPDLHLALTIRALDPEGDESAIYQMLDSVVDGENVITKDRFTSEEFIDFIEGFEPKDIKKIGVFVENIPTNKINIKASCPKCKKEFSYTTGGVASFLV